MAITFKQAVDRFLARAALFLAPHMPVLRASFKWLGILFWWPVLLFPVFVTRIGLHWWGNPALHGVTLALFWSMALTATAFAFAYVFCVSPFFLLALWRGKITAAGPNRAFKWFSFTALPIVQGVVAAWSDAYLAGQRAHLLSEIGLLLYLMCYGAGILVVVFQVFSSLRRIRHRTAS